MSKPNLVRLAEFARETGRSKRATERQCLEWETKLGCQIIHKFGPRKATLVNRALLAALFGPEGQAKRIAALEAKNTDLEQAVRDLQTLFVEEGTLIWVGSGEERHLVRASAYGEIPRRRRSRG